MEQLVEDVEEVLPILVELGQDSLGPHHCHSQLLGYLVHWGSG